MTSATSRALSTHPQSADDVFVGRARELEELRLGLAAALRGFARLHLVTGEPGIGKTRLVERFETEAERSGVRVLRAHCWEDEGAPEYWPWVQIVRGYARVASPQELAADLAGGAPFVAGIAPEIAERMPGAVIERPPVSSDGEQARFALFDSIATLLRNASARTPLLVRLGDLHAADRSSVLLLRFLVPELSISRILFVGTYRDAAAQRKPDVGSLLAELAVAARSVPLRPFSTREVAALAEAVSGRRPAKTAVEAIEQATGGNPFFAHELVRLLVRDGRLGDVGRATLSAAEIPYGLHEAVRRRLAPLSERCRTALSVAAALGREFAVPLLQRIADVDAERLLDAIHEASVNGLVVEVPPFRGTFAFAQSLVRETLYEELSPLERLRLHRRIVEALEALHASNPEPHLPALAHHAFVAAMLGGDVDKAIEHCSRAADRALGRLAYDEAVAHYERALQALERKEGADPLDRCRLLLALGTARGDGGEGAAARKAFREASELARAAGDGAMLARAALGFAGGFVLVPSGSSKDAEALLDEALETLGHRDPSLRASLLARLALSLYFSGPAQRRDELTREALELARRSEDRAVLATALIARHMSVWLPENLEERAAMAEEAVRLARAIDDPGLAVQCHAMQIIDLLEAGDLAAAGGAIDAHAEIAEKLRQPLHLWQSSWFRATRALLEGDFRAAERHAARALQMGGSARSRYGAGTVELQSFAIRWQRSRRRIDDLEAIVRRLDAERLKVPSWRAALVGLMHEVGRHDEARREFRALAAMRFADLPRDATWLTAIALLAEYCATVDDADGARVLYELLSPYEDRNVVAAYAIVCYGSVARYLGLLATSLRRWDAAERHFEEARTMHARMGARPLGAETDLGHARMLLLRDQPGDAERAHRLLSRALAAARELDMPALARRAAALIAAPEGAPSEAAVATFDGAAAAGKPVFHSDGAEWMVAWGRKTLHLPDTKGMRYIAALLRRRGERVPVTELVAGADAGERPEEPATTAAAAPSAAAERARKAVTNRLRDAIAAIQAKHPSLGAHLARAIRTGAYCSYRPSHPVDWSF